MRGDDGLQTASTRATITVAVVNDYEVIVQGLLAILSRAPDVRVVELDVGTEPTRHADVALFDTFASQKHALYRARKMVDEGVVDHVVLYTWDASAAFLDLARTVGVSGVVFKSQTGDGLVDAIRRVVAGEHIGFERVGSQRTRAGGSLSDREQEVLALLALGYSNQAIAEELFLSIDTVKSHLRRLYTKLGVGNRTQAALLAGEHRLGPPPQRQERGR